MQSLHLPLLQTLSILATPEVLTTPRLLVCTCTDQYSTEEEFSRWNPCIFKYLNQANARILLITCLDTLEHQKKTTAESPTQQGL